MPKKAKKLSESDKAILRLYWNEPITEIRICRAPKLGPLRKLEQQIEDGEDIEKKIRYDNLFRLFLLIDFTDGQTIQLEKTKKLKLREFDSKLSKQYEVMVLEPDAHNKDDVWTLGELWHNLDGHLEGNILEYDPVKNNNQVFIYNFLRASSIATRASYKFISEDINSILSRMEGKLKGVPKNILQLVDEYAIH